MGQKFKTGSEVECQCLDEENNSNVAIWYETRIVRKKGQDYLLEFEGGRRLFIPSNHVRPPQPKDAQKIKPGDSIDVYINGGGWKQCSALSCKESSLIEVLFLDEYSETKEVDSSNIRLHREYDGEYWVPKIEGWNPKLPDFSLEYPYHCLACPNSKKSWFKSSKQVKDHYHTNHKSSKFFCNDCGNGFGTKTLCTAHKKKYNH